MISLVHPRVVGECGMPVLAQRSGLPGRGARCSREMRQEHVAEPRLGFLRPDMDGKFFRLADNRWARLMDYELDERKIAEIHLAAVADQLPRQVMRGFDPRREILLADRIHLPHEWTSPLTHPRRTTQDVVDRHQDTRSSS